MQNIFLGERNELRNRDLQIIDSAVPVNYTVKTLSDTVNDTVSDTVLTLIVANPHITATEISQKLNIGIATAKRRLKKLKDNDIIERIGSDKSGYWQVRNK